MAANNNIFVTVCVKDGEILTTPKKYSIPCRNAIVTDATNPDVARVSSEIRFYHGGVERVYQLDKTAFSVHALINGALLSESGAES